MAVTAANAHHTVGVQFEVPDPRRTIHRVKHWLQVSDPGFNGAGRSRTMGSHAGDPWGQASPLYVETF